MKNYELLIEKIDEGIAYLDRQSKKLDPVIDYLTLLCIQKKEELSPDLAFQYIIEFMKMKNDALLLQVKMREILKYCGK